MQTTINLQPEYYKSGIAVFGDTKPWAVNLRQLGGSFNKNLGGRPGWVFARNQESQVLTFISQAQQGLIQPTAYTQQTNTYAQPTPMAPFGQTQPAMTPMAAMARLTLQQPVVAQPPLTLTQPVVAQPPLTLTQPTPMLPQPVTPPPVTVLPSQPLTVTFPNMFVAADGLTYQIIMYTVPVPTVGQVVTLATGDATIEYTVSAIEKQTAPLDSILLAQTLPDTAEEGTQAPTSRAIVANGTWKIHGMQNDHTLTFHPPNN